MFSVSIMTFAFTVLSDTCEIIFLNIICNFRFTISSSLHKAIFNCHCSNLYKLKKLLGIFSDLSSAPLLNFPFLISPVN